jgi:ribosome maturation factor RimP
LEVGEPVPHFFYFVSVDRRRAMGDSLARELEERVEALGFELVELERAGSPRRPILRLRVDRPDSTPGAGVTLDDCAAVSRALEAWLDERPGLSETYVLEVSSPGVERPLVRARDFERFAGQEVAVQGKAPLAGRAKRLEGVLVGLAGEGERVVLRLAGGEELEIPRGEITRAHLLYRWGGEGRKA